MRRLLLLASLALFLACPGRLDDPDRFLDGGGGDGGTGGGSGACNAETDIFAVKCSGAGCHTPPADNSLDLVSAGVASRLTGSSPVCTGHPYSTYVHAKLTQSTPPCGAQMPFLQPMLSAAEIACVDAYMAALGGGDGGTTDGGSDGGP